MATQQYLVQFQELTHDYFKTDCAFRDGQLHLAKCYVRMIVDALNYVAEGRVLDGETCVFKYPQ